MTRCNGRHRPPTRRLYLVHPRRAPRCRADTLPAWMLSLYWVCVGVNLGGLGLFQWSFWGGKPADLWWSLLHLAVLGLLYRGSPWRRWRV